MKLFCTITGSLCVTLGVIGIFVPLLPTTPLLLLAAFLYFRGSERLYRWLTEHRVLGKYIREYRENKAMPLRAKIISIILLWISIPSCMVFHVPHLWINVLLGIVLVCVTVYILSLKTS